VINITQLAEIHTALDDMSIVISVISAIAQLASCQWLQSVFDDLANAICKPLVSGLEAITTADAIVGSLTYPATKAALTYFTSFVVVPKGSVAAAGGVGFGRGVELTGYAANPPLQTDMLASPVESNVLFTAADQDILFAAAPVIDPTETAPDTVTVHILPSAPAGAVVEPAPSYP